MKRFILTGAPGAGKTVLLRQLELKGFGVVEEAATDLIALLQAQGIAEPWTRPDFIDAIANLQCQRLDRSSSAPDAIQFHDRSPVCTAALATYLGYPLPASLARELRRIGREKIYQPQVFFIRNLGFVTPTGARRITFEETLRFEKIHEDIYRERGYDLVFIEPGPIAERVAVIFAAVETQSQPAALHL